MVIPTRRNNALRIDVIKRERLRSAPPAPDGNCRPMPVFNGRAGLARGLSGLSTREMIDAEDNAVHVITS
jgi:hypothetical protein